MKRPDERRAVPSDSSLRQAPAPSDAFPVFGRLQRRSTPLSTPAMDSAAAEIFHQDDNVGGKPGHECQRPNHQDGQYERVQQNPAGAEGDVADLSLHALHGAALRPEVLLGMAPLGPLEP